MVIDKDTMECTYYHLNCLNDDDFSSEIGVSEMDFVTQTYSNANKLDVHAKYFLAKIHLARRQFKDMRFCKAYGFSATHFMPSTNKIHRTTRFVLFDEHGEKYFANIDRSLAIDASKCLNVFFKETNFVEWFKNDPDVIKYGSHVLSATLTTIEKLDGATFFYLCKEFAKIGVINLSNVKIYEKLNNLSLYSESYWKNLLKEADVDYIKRVSLKVKIKDRSFYVCLNQEVSRPLPNNR